jgi:septal ring-binding cell division protein DamX
MSAPHLVQPARGGLLTSTNRQLLNKAFERILVERCGVMLISADDQLLALHASLLQEMLRQDSGLLVSTIEEGNESRLLERFNGLLGHLSVDQARAAATADGVGHVWILSVQSAEQFAVAKTIARMAHDFPGSNLSLVLLIEPEWAQALAKTRPGREMMRCSFSSAADPGHLDAPSLPAHAAEVSADPERSGPGMRQLVTDSVETLVRAVVLRRQGLSFRVLVFSLLLLIASAALVGMLFYSSKASMERESKPAEVALSSPLSLNAALEGTRPAPDVAVTVPVATVALAVSPSAASRQPETSPSDLQLRLEATQSWLAAAPANTHTIQLVGSNDEKQVEAYLQRLRAMVNAEEIRVFRTKAGGRDSMTVIWGSFADAREAVVARDQLPAELRSAKPILRTVQGINAELRR